MAVRFGLKIQGLNIFKISFISKSAAETRKIAGQLAKNLAPNTLLLLEGNLGSGKTVFVQGVAKGLKINPKDIRSPTFAIMQEHHGKISLCHADLYRLKEEEISSLGLEEYLQTNFYPQHFSSVKSSGWIVAIEWADKAKIFLKEICRNVNWLRIQMETVSEKSRKITFSGHAPLCRHSRTRGNPVFVQCNPPNRRTGCQFS